MQDDDHMDGDLTFTHGFLPRRLHATPLSDEYAIWEEVAIRLPALAFTREVRAVLGDVPLLSASPEDLADHNLKRAATLLGIIAHSYWRLGLESLYLSRNSDTSDQLPESIRKPWHEVCRRMGRSRPGLTLEDAFFNNFTFVSDELRRPMGEYRIEDVAVNSVRPMIPVYGTETERVFTGVFVEVNAVIGPAVREVCRIENAIRQGGVDARLEVAQALDSVASCVKAGTRALRKAHPSATSSTFCDPVEWAKTLATWALPPEGYPPGPSGSAAPIAHLMDAVIGRTDYSSDLGRYALELRASQLPTKQRHFFELISALNIRGYVESIRAAGREPFKETAEAFNRVVDALVGPAGFLSVHKGKVVNYLGVGAAVGRNETTAHDQTHLVDSTWTTIADHLRVTINEREVRRIRLP